MLSGVLKKEGIGVSHQSTYNLIHADASGELARHTRHKLKYRIPKHTNFDDVTDKKMASIEKKINSRPRQKLKFETPKAEFFKRIA